MVGKLARKKAGKVAKAAKEDVTMTPVEKVKKTINKSKRRQQAAAAAKAGAPAGKPESKKERRKRIALTALAGSRVPGSAAAETPEALKQRHAEEWKEMKA